MAKAKKFVIILFSLFVVFASAILMNFKPVDKVVFAKESLGFYSNQLDELGKKFYLALGEMKQQGVLKSGKANYDLLENNVLSAGQVEAFQNGDNQILKAFGAGRDAFYLENPDLFYLDFDKISLNLAKSDEGYLASIGTGRVDDYYVSGITESNIEEKLALFEQEFLKSKTKLDSLTSTKEKIELGNKIVCDLTEYSFTADGSEEQIAQIRSPFGVFVNGYAVCEGYSKAFKMLMDSQNIPCVEVVGYYYDNDNPEPHAWNYVKLDEKWYLVDATYNDSAKQQTDYLLLGSENTALYQESSTISNSGAEFDYPKLATFDFGTEEIKTVVKYSDDGNISSQDISFDYKGLSTSDQLSQNGLCLAIRHEIFDSGNNYCGWGKAYKIYNEHGQISINQNTFSTQLFVTSQQLIEGEIYDLDQSKIVAKSDVLFNEIYNYGKTAPKVLETTPSASSVLDADTVYDISIRYDSTLKTKDTSKQIGIFVYNEKSSNLNDYVKVENLKVENDTISFKFTPSKMFEHDNLAYKFLPQNIVSQVGGEEFVPNPALLVFARPWVVCGKMFGDERLYINSYGAPTLIDNKDLSMTGFLDESGNQVAENQRSQLVLVAKKPSVQIQSEMTENVEDVLTGQLVDSATYELDLHICGGVTQIPAGSFVKLSFGFPEGYGPKDKGVTFKVFHFKKDSTGKIDPSKTEELDCVVTEYGIVVCVNNFSPFMLAVVKDQENQTKNIYTKTTGEGGYFETTITKDQITTNKKGIVTVGKDESVCVKVHANEGYEVEYVMLNKKIVELTDGKLCLSYNQLEDNNQIEIGFVSSNVKEFEESNGITNLNKFFLQNENVEKAEENNKTDSKDKILPVMICLTISAMFVIAVAILLNKKRKTN